MLKWMFRGAVALVVAFLAVSFWLPAALVVEETVTLSAKPETLQPLLSDFRRWPEWTQFNAKNDATVKWSYSGPPTGAGSVAEWTGKEMGSGKLEMLSGDAKSVRFRVLSKSHVPAEGHIVVEPAAGGSVVTWTMTEEITPLLRLFAVGTKPAIKDELHTQLIKLSEVATANP